MTDSSVWSTLMRDCEERLLESERAIREALDLLRRARALVEVSESRLNEHTLTSLLEAHKEELLAVLSSQAANSVGPQNVPTEFRPILVYNEDDKSYRMGRRTVALTETEKQILDQLRNTAPEPVSRRRLHESLYPDGEKAGLGAIDVYLSKLRQKLKLAGNGQEFIQSMRGQGWALNPSLYTVSKKASPDRA